MAYNFIKKETVDENALSDLAESFEKLLTLGSKMPERAHYDAGPYIQDVISIAHLQNLLKPQNVCLQSDSSVDKSGNLLFNKNAIHVDEHSIQDEQLKLIDHNYCKKSDFFNFENTSLASNDGKNGEMRENQEEKSFEKELTTIRLNKWDLDNLQDHGDKNNVGINTFEQIIKKLLSPRVMLERLPERCLAKKSVIIKTQILSKVCEEEPMIECSIDDDAADYDFTPTTAKIGSNAKKRNDNTLVKIRMKKMIRQYCPNCHATAWTDRSLRLASSQRQRCPTCSHSSMLKQCIKCGKLYDKYSNMFQHLRKCHDHRPSGGSATKDYRCDACDYATFTRRGIDRHRRVKHGRDKARRKEAAPASYECANCGLAFGWRNSIVKHLRWCSSNKELGCDGSSDCTARHFSVRGCKEIEDNKIASTTPTTSNGDALRFNIDQM